MRVLLLLFGAITCTRLVVIKTYTWGKMNYKTQLNVTRKINHIFYVFIEELWKLVKYDKKIYILYVFMRVLLVYVPNKSVTWIWKKNNNNIWAGAELNYGKKNTTAFDAV